MRCDRCIRVRPEYLSEGLADDSRSIMAEPRFSHVPLTTDTARQVPRARRGRQRVADHVYAPPSFVHERQRAPLFDHQSGSVGELLYELEIGGGVGLRSDAASTKEAADPKDLPLVAPSVITMNALSTALALNDFLLM